MKYKKLPKKASGGETGGEKNTSSFSKKYKAPTTKPLASLDDDEWSTDQWGNKHRKTNDYASWYDYQTRREQGEEPAIRVTLKRPPESYYTPTPPRPRETTTRINPTIPSIVPQLKSAPTREPQYVQSNPKPIYYLGKAYGFNGDVYEPIEYEGEINANKFTIPNTDEEFRNAVKNNPRKRNYEQVMKDGGFTMLKSLTPAISAANPLLGATVGLGLNFIESAVNQNPYINPASKEERLTSNGIGYKAKGGYSMPRFEAEGEEVALGNIQIPGSDASSMGKIIKGPKHENGGVKGKGKGFILTDRYKVDGTPVGKGEKSIADEAKPYMKWLAKHEKEDKVSPRAVSIVREKLENLAKINDELVSLQDSNIMLGGGYTDNNAHSFYQLEDFTKGLALSPYMSARIDEKVNAPTQPLNLGVPPRPYGPQMEAVQEVDKLTNFLREGYSPKDMIPTPNTIKDINSPLAREADAASTKTEDDYFKPQFTGMDLAGIGVQALTSGLQLWNTQRNKNKTIAPINPYLGVSKRAEDTYRESMSQLDVDKAQAIQQIDDQYALGVNNPISNSINVDRAGKANLFGSAMRGKTEAALKYDSAKAAQKGQLAQIELQGDMYKAQGEGMVNESLRADLDNYFTNIGRNIQDISGVAQNIMKMWNESKSEAQTLNMLKGAFPDLTIQELAGIIQIVKRG